MAATGADDGSEDVADFLERIKELGDKRQKEDEERARKLEEEILQGRRERQARRAERARSISPTKDSSLSSSASLLHSQSPGSPHAQTPSTQRTSKADTSSTNLESDPSAFEPSKPSPPPSTSLSRSGTLSWQQRPTSRGSGARNRPLSQIASENAARSPRATPEPSTEDRELSLSEKAQALQSKDPSWFRQTADRGTGSAAYRKNQDPLELRTENIRLPGLSRESSIEPDNMSSSGQTPPSQSQRASPVAPSPSETRDKISDSGQSNIAKSPFPVLASQKFDPPSEVTAASAEGMLISRSPIMSPSQGRISPDRLDRPASPTKGLGGFVQSAMLKRSDSVNKRLSQQTPSLSRGNSTASNRGAPSPMTKPSSLRGDTSRESTPASAASSSRPGSSHSTDTVTQASQTSRDGEFVKPALPVRSFQEPTSTQSSAQFSKRWSPTKQSWMESAINRPESPTKIKPANRKQPDWMENVAKAREARGGSIDLKKGVSHKEVPVGGLLRSPDMGARIPSPTRAEPVHRSSVPLVNRDFSTAEHASQGLETDTAAALDRGVGNDSSVTSESAIEPSSEASTDSKSAPISVRTPARGEPSAESPKSTQRPPVKPKPSTPPKTDLRASLRSRQARADSNNDNVPEFKKAFSSLRRAETKNYKAPDELKDNIMKGKNALNATGGPKKTQRVDEFKESINKKRSEFEGSKSDLITGNFLSRNPSGKNKPAIPEALAKRQLMSSKVVESPTLSETTSTPTGSLRSRTGSEKEKPAVPEALAKRQMIASRITNAARAGGKIGDDLLKDDNEVLEQTTVEESGPLDSSGSVRPKTPTLRAEGMIQSSPASGSTLAGRFNPLLAGIIGRGPSARSLDSEISPERSSIDQQAPPDADLGGGHATKGRARGPKRRSAKAPASIVNAADAEDWLNTPVPKKPTMGQSNAFGGRLVRENAVPNLRIGLSPGEMPESMLARENRFKNPPATKPKRIDSLQAGTSAQSPIGGLGIMPSHADSPFVSSPALNTSKSPKSPPVPRKKPETISIARSSPAPVSPIKPDTHPSIVFKKFFRDSPGSISGRLDVDTEAVITGNSDPPDRVKTRKKEIYRVDGDGKKTPISTEQDHILFEEEMYLVVHVYHTSNWKEKTVVYLWCGDGVSTSSLDDALVFCRSSARSAGTNLTLIRQGKEPYDFFEALGGILIIRRSDSKAGMQDDSFLLCGRHHLGQIAFDEVDFHVSSLCSGFAYLVKRRSDVYLWAGKGASPAEIGCARLIGMNLASSNGASSEVKEITEGKEPDKFWTIFDAVDERNEMDVDWTKKAASDKYRTRLFYVDGDLKRQSAGAAAVASLVNWARRGSSSESDNGATVDIQEITPYTQADIGWDMIMVLDTFFKVIVIVPTGAGSKLASFRAALFFAKEYSMLVAALQDRAIPVGVVEMAQASNDIKTAFRKWEDNKTSLLPGQLVIPLQEALEAM